jgi:hypothetical protein
MKTPSKQAIRFMIGYLQAHIASRLSAVAVVTLVLIPFLITGLYAVFFQYPQKLQDATFDLSVKRDEIARNATAQQSNIVEVAPPLSSIFIEPAFINNVSRELHAIAGKFSVNVVRTTLKDDKDSTSLPRNIEIQLSVIGTYPQIRGLLVASLNRIDALAVQSVELKRRSSTGELPNMNGTQLEALLTLRVFVQDKR